MSFTKPEESTVTFQISLWRYNVNSSYEEAIKAKAIDNIGMKSTAL